jgi:predicted exporter
MGSLFVAVYNFFEKKHLLLWSILCIICVVCIWSITRLSFDTNIQKMMPSNDVTNSMNNYVVNADHSNKIIFCISNKTPSNDLDSLLSAKLWLDSLIHAYSNTDLLTGTHEESIDPGDLIQIIHNNLPYFLEEKDYKQLNDAIQEDHIKKYLSKQKELLQTPSGVLINQLVSADPMGIANIALQKFNKLAAQSNLQLKDGVMISEDEQTVLFIISSAHKSSETGRNQQLIDKIDKAIQDCKQQYPNFNIQYFGGPAVGAGNATQMKFDTILTLSLSIIALLAVTWYVFRKKRITILLFTPVIFGVLLALASCYWIKGSISILALGIGAIILGIALDFSIHFFSHARKAKSIKDNISELAHPLTLGAITTIGAFFILTYANAPVLQDLGWFAAIGLLGASVFTLIFLPHLLSDKWITSTHYKVTLLDKLAKWQPEKNKLLLLLIVIISPILWHYSKNVSFDSNLMHMNYMSSSLKSAENKISQHLDFTLGNVFIINKSADLHQLQMNDERIQSIIDTLAMQKAVRYGINPATLLPVEPIAEKRLAIWEAFWTPEKINLAKHNIALAAAAIGFNKELAANFQPNNLILNLYNDSGAYRYIAQMHPFSYKLTDSHLYVGVSQLKIEPGQREQVFNAFKNINNIIVTDNQNLNEQLLHFINIDFNNLIFYSGLLVFIALLIAYGRIELALISFLPMALSWIWILGIMSLAGLQFNFINIIICTLIFGLGDDYSIFMMDSLIHKYKYGHQKLDNARSAVYLSAITTLIGLGVLIFAQHPALKSIAFIAVIGLTSFFV